jgi:putative endonuclease
VKQYFVYVLFCLDGTYYTGMTSNLEKRVAEHHYGVNPDCYTFTRRPLILVHSSSSDDVRDAITCEKKLKGWSHAKKSALIRDDWNSLKSLSRKPRKSAPAMPRSDG